MKKLFFLIMFTFAFGIVTAQEKLSKEEKERRAKNIQAGNPFARFGHKAQVATLSNGKYLEFHDLDSIVTIGSVRFHVDHKQIVANIVRDTLDPNVQPIGDTAGRWISPDPLAEEARRWSPYNYTMDNPVLFIDVDGLYVDTSWIYRKNKDGDYVNKKLVEAFETFAKSKEGISFLGNFAEKGQVIAGHEYTESGKFDTKNIDLNYAEAKNEESIGDAYTSKETKDKKGIQITINLFPSAKADALIDDIGHESFLHAEPIAKDFYDDKKFNLSPIDKDIVKQLEDANYPKKWRENAAHHMQDMRYNILDKKVVPILRNYYNSKNIKKTDAQIRKERPRGY